MNYYGPKAQAYLEKMIRIRGGVNPYGEPLYRLVWAPARLEKSGGEWYDWGNLDINERNPGKNRAIRSEIGYREVQKYGNKPLWILEKWMPASYFGSRENWYRPQSEGGTMIWCPGTGQYVASLGDYPERGEYSDTVYAFPTQALTEAVVLTAIGRLQHHIDHDAPSTIEGRIRRRSYLQRKAYDEAQEKYADWAVDVMGESDFAFHGQPFVGVGPKRAHSSKAMLDKLHISEHHID